MAPGAPAFTGTWLVLCCCQAPPCCVSSVTQPAAKLTKTDLLAKLKGSLGAAIAKAKAGNKPGEKLPTSPPPANQRPANGDPFAVPAPGFVADPGAGDLGSL